MKISDLDPYLFRYGLYSTGHKKDWIRSSGFSKSLFCSDYDVVVIAYSVTFDCVCKFEILCDFHFLFHPLFFFIEIQCSEDEKMERRNCWSILSPYDFDLVGAGLRNIGNNCYLNSVLQCLIHTVPLVEKLRSSDHHYLNCGNDGDFCSHCAFMKLVDLCMDKSGSAVTPFDFLDNLSKISSAFWLGEQQDAHEFLTCFLNNLHSCCLDPGSRDQPSSMDEDSLVNHVFGGWIMSQLRCCECGHCSSKPESLLNISLEIDDADTLTDALESFTKVEKIEEAKFSCEGCKSEVLMEKQLKIEQAPEVISFHLKRFRNNGLVTDKIDKFIEYPLELDLRPFMSCPRAEEQPIYDLYAVLVHKGKASYGHYYCFIRSSPSTWHSMNDSRIHRVSEMNALKQMAYFLFYIKQGSSPWFCSLMDTHYSSYWLCSFTEGQNTQMDTSPKSVLHCTGGSEIFSPAEETSTSNLNETPDKEEKSGSCRDASAESSTNNTTCNHSSCTSDNAAKSLFQAQHTERTNSEQLAINSVDIFDDELVESLLEKMTEEEEEKDLNGACLADESVQRLVRDMPSSRRSAFLSCLPTNEKHVSKSSSIISKPRPPNNKKRRKM